MVILEEVMSEAKLTKKDIDYARVQWTRILNDPDNCQHHMAAEILEYLDKLEKGEGSG